MGKIIYRVQTESGFTDSFNESDISTMQALHLIEPDDAKSSPATKHWREVRAFKRRES